MDIKIQYNDPFYTNRLNERDYPLHELGLIDGFFTYINNSEDLYVGNTQPNFNPILETDDGNSYAFISYEGKSLRISLSTGESPTLIATKNNLITHLGGLSSNNEFGIVNIYLGVHWENNENSDAKFFIDSGSKGWVNTTSILYSGGSAIEPTPETITTFLNTNFTSVDDIRKPLKVSISGISDIVLRNRLVEYLRLISYAKLRCISPAKYILYDNKEYLSIVIGQILIRGNFTSTSTIYDTANDTTLSVDNKNYSKAVAGNAYLLHDNINYGGYKKALLDILETLINININGITYGTATPKAKSVGFSHLDSDLYFYIAKGADVLPVDSTYYNKNLEDMNDPLSINNSYKGKTHIIKRYFIPINAVFDTMTWKPKYNSLYFEFNFQRVKKTNTDNTIQPYLIFGMQFIYWNIFTTNPAYGLLSYLNLSLNSNDPYAYNTFMPSSPVSSSRSMYRTKNLSSFKELSTSFPNGSFNQVTGGWKCGLFNSSFLNYLKKRDPMYLGDSFDKTNHIFSSTSDLISNYGSNYYLPLFVYVCPSHNYVAGEWIVKRLSLSLSSEYLENGQGYSWGLRISQAVN